jgi:tRNA nucleotidyltransferase (CCA-adding enzyme)
LEAHVHVHERFGTAVIILPDGFKLDVATARTEYYEYPTALPAVTHSSIQKDLYRRDFTINTLAIRLNGRHFGALLDLYGGQRDLKDHTIRVLHSLSFVEDPTRVFRAIRFAHRFGFHLGKETLALIKGAVKMDLLHRLSGHRLLTELILLCQENEPRQALAQLGALDLLQFIHPSLCWSPRLPILLKAVEEVLDWYTLLYLDRPIDVWLVYCMALLEALPTQAVEETIQRLTIPKGHAEKMRAAHASAHAILHHLVQHPAPRPAAVYRLLSGLADETLLLLMAKTTSDAARRQISAYLTTYQHVKPMLTGADLHTMGLTPGPRFREILESLRAARLNGDVTTAADERALVQQMAQPYRDCYVPGHKFFSPLPDQGEGQGEGRSPALEPLTPTLSPKGRGRKIGKNFCPGT